MARVQVIFLFLNIGTGPSTLLSSIKSYPIAGLVLHSGYSSGLRIMINNMKKTYKKDFFPTIELI